MRILVTGGSGLVGRYVVNELANSHAVDVLDVKPPHRSDIRHLAVDVLLLPKLSEAVRGYDAVVHLAGIPHPLNNPAEEVFRVNALGTFNVLESCARAGIQKFVFMSSESTLGFAFSATPLSPLYLPIDEQHVLRPQDPYGVSKVTGELLCRSYSDRYGLDSVCLRAPWIWVPEEKERTLYRQLIAEYPNWYKNLWAFVHVNDVAAAIHLALTAKLQRKHEVLFVCAAENWTGKESRDLVRQFYPDTKELRKGFQGTSSLISAAKAKSLLNFAPRYGVSDVLA